MAASDSGFEPNDAFFDSLGRDPGVVALCKSAADAIASTARASADVDTGAYRDGIVVRERSAAHRDTFRVVATDDASMGVEARTGNLARALSKTRIY